MIYCYCVITLLAGQFVAAFRLDHLNFFFFFLQGESVAWLTSIFGAGCILLCTNTPHQEGISNAPKEFSNKSPADYMHG